MKLKFILFIIVCLLVSGVANATWWNTSYQYKMLINTSNFTTSTFFYINGSNGVDIKGTIIYPIARTTTGNVSLYFNNATDYSIIENDTIVQNNIYSNEVIAYYKADETSSSSNLIDAIERYNFTQVGSPLSTTGKILNGRVVNNTGVQYFNRDNAFLSPLSTADFTITLWIKRLQSEENTIIFSSGLTTGSNNQGVTIYWKDADANKIAFRGIGSDTTGYVVASTSTLAQDTWYMVTVKKNSTHISLFINGIFNNTATYTQTGNWWSSTNAAVGCIYLSGSPSASNIPKNNIDDLVIYNKSLSSAEILQRYNNNINVNGFGDVYATEQGGSGTPIVNSINITTYYSGGGYTSEYIYVPFQNITCITNTTSANSIKYNWFVNSISVLNNSIVLPLSGINVGDNIYCQVNATNSTFNTSTLANSRVYTVLGSVFQFSNTGNNWNLNNLTVFTGSKHNLSINITFAQSDLFATYLNVTCDITGTIFSATNTSINTSTLNYYINNISLNYPFQRCRIFMTSSDSHTAQLIPNYIQQKTTKGILFNTSISNIEITSNENDYNDISTRKLMDRVTFEFDYNSKSLTRSYTVHSDNKLYYLPNSRYKGHFVSWNEQTKIGNWIDFEQQNSDNYNYDINKIDDYTYTVIVSPIILIPDEEIVLEQKGILKFLGIGELETIEEAKINDYGIDNIKFETLGNTNVYNLTAFFYIGGQINLSSFNKYDNSNITNYSVVVSTSSGFPPISQTFNIVNKSGLGFIENVTNGTYIFNFTTPYFFDSIQTVIMNNVSKSVLYNTSQSLLSIYVTDLLIGQPVTNYSVYLYDGTFLTQRNVTTINGYISIPLNATTYLYNVTGPGYLIAGGTTAPTYKENLTLTVGLGYLANFTIWDEVTGGLFNMGDATLPTLMIYCPTSNIIYNLSVNKFTVPVSCVYSKFQIQMYFNDTGTTPIYRTYIIAPTALKGINAYFANGQTTPLVYITFQLSDTLSQYPVAGLYISRYINTTYATITADYTDIENKVASYLVQNVYYNVDLYSNGVLAKNLGQYDADVTGTKILTLFGITITPYVTGINTPHVFFQASNATGLLIINGTFIDPSNTTTSIRFELYNGTIKNSTFLINSQVINAATGFFTYDATAYFYDEIDARFSYIQSTQPTITQTIGGDVVWYLTGIWVFPLMTFIGPLALHIAIMILLIVLTLYATTGNVAEISMVASFLGLVFTIMGWLDTRLMPVMAVLCIMNGISIFKKGNKRADVMGQ